MNSDNYSTASSYPGDAVNLTPKNLKEAIRFFESIQPVCGIACHPSAVEKIRSEQGVPPDPVRSMFQAIPLLIDPRLNSRTAEVHRNQHAWRKRCREQREWDAKKPTS